MTRRGCLVGLAVSLALLAVPALLLLPPMLRNNREMREWKATLYDTPLPDGATIEDRGSEFGFLGGNGNHCDFLAWVVLGTELSDRRVEAHYENALNHLEFGLVTAETVSPGRVRVELFDSREAGWDLRCH